MTINVIRLWAICTIKKHIHFGETSKVDLKLARKKVKTFKVLAVNYDLK